jgi:hypothetical protein
VAAGAAFAADEVVLSQNGVAIVSTDTNTVIRQAGKPDVTVKGEFGRIFESLSVIDPKAGIAVLQEDAGTSCLGGDWKLLNLNTGVLKDIEKTSCEEATAMKIEGKVIVVSLFSGKKIKLPLK